LAILGWPGATVSKVDIQGNRLTSTTAIRRLMKTCPGKEYRQGILVEDVRRLYATRRFGNVWADTVRDGIGRVRVQVFIRECPNQIRTVTYLGNHTLSNDRLKQVTDLHPGLPLNPLANKVACWKIVQRYREEGRPFARCDLIEGGEVDDSRVVFRITEGRRSRLKAVGVSGQGSNLNGMLRKSSTFSLKLLKADLDKHPPWLTSEDVRHLIEVYRASGFPEAWIDRDLVYSADEREVTIVLSIQEGPRRTPEDRKATPIRLSPDRPPEGPEEINRWLERGIQNVRRIEPCVTEGS
jgi:outer membrane protein assembly factor BamA